MVNPMPYTSLNLQFWRLHTSHLEGKLLGILGMVSCIESTVDVFVESFVGSVFVAEAGLAAGCLTKLCGWEAAGCLVRAVGPAKDGTRRGQVTGPAWLWVCLNLGCLHI